MTRRPWNGDTGAAWEPIVAPRWSPEWWAAWTASIHRSGRYDDEDPPSPADGLTPWWHHVDTSSREWDRWPRQHWEELSAGQWSTAPTPTDWCCVDGRCVGTCNSIDDDA